MRRTFTAVAVTAAMTLAPVGAAFAQDAGTDGASEPTETTGTADAGSVLEAWLAAIQDLYDQLTGADETDDASADDGGAEEEGSEEEGTGDEGSGEAEDTDLLEALLQALLDGVEIEFMVAEAMEDVDQDDVEGTEEDPELTEEIEGTEDEADEPHGHVVRLVAQCAPRGQEARGFLAGAANHGAYVSAVARGDAISLSVPTIEVDEAGTRTLGEPTILDLTVTTVEDAELLCDALATIAEARALAAELEAAEDEDDEVASLEADEEDADRGRPDRAGKPDHTGKPDRAGAAGGDGGTRGRPDTAGKPSWAGKPGGDA